MNITVIYNPVAGGTNHKKRFLQLQYFLQSYGHTLSFQGTGKAGDATRLAQEAVYQSAEMVLAVGGDGTVNEVIQGLAGSTVPLAVYPAGTTNVWCHQIGMPKDPRRAAEIIHSGPHRSIDLGLAGKRYFLLMAGIGIDAEVTRAVNLELKRKFGMIIYAIEALRLSFMFPTTHARIVLEPGSEFEKIVQTKISLIVATNAERYAIVKLAPEAQIDDGRLELLVFQSTNPWDRIIAAVSIFFNVSSNLSKVKRFRVRQANIEIFPDVPMQLDGDLSGSVGLSPLEISCIPSALYVVVPSTAPAHLFSN